MTVDLKERARELYLKLTKLNDELMGKNGG